MRREPAQEVSARRIGGVSERDQEEEQRRERACVLGRTTAIQAAEVTARRGESDYVSTQRPNQHNQCARRIRELWQLRAFHRSYASYRMETRAEHAREQCVCLSSLQRCLCFCVFLV